MTKLMDSAAVGIRTGGDAAEILQSYIATGPAMVFSRSPSIVQQKPKTPGAGGNQR